MDSMDVFERVERVRQYVQQRVQIRPEVAIITGTGMGRMEEEMSAAIAIPYSSIPGFAVSTVESHRGTLYAGIIGSCPVLLFSGRIHCYEGYSAAEVAFPVRVAKAMGVKQLIMTNAAGGVHPHYEEGDLVMVTDHINLMPDHPLRGPNDDRLGVRFPDMLNAYDPVMRQKFNDLATEMNISLKSGVYLALQGPSLETPAEYRMIRLLGADLVGMSTVPEVIVARHEKLEVAVFSVVSNVCFPASRLTETTLEAVIQTVGVSSEKLTRLLKIYLSRQSN